VSLQVPDSVIGAIRRPAHYGVSTGRLNTQLEQSYFARCGHFHWATGTIILFTHDTGHHTGGWFKNPDFERCQHLSLSFIAPWPDRPDDELGNWRRIGMMMPTLHDQYGRLPFNRTLAEIWVKAIFRDDRRLLWSEGPFSENGRVAMVNHFRLFCDRAWTPIKPRGEVYSRELTEAGWQSYSDIGAPMPRRVNAD
jgi:hypothetical protein